MGILPPIFGQTVWIEYEMSLDDFQNSVDKNGSAGAIPA